MQAFLCENTLKISIFLSFFVVVEQKSADYGKNCINLLNKFIKPIAKLKDCGIIEP
jgi:hypothetical protein